MSLTEGGREERVTPVYRYPLPPRVPGRFEPRFNGNGQYHLPHPLTGKPRGFTRASTVAKAIEETYMLQKWEQRQVLIGVQRSIGLAADLDQLISEHLDPSGGNGDYATLAADLRAPLNAMAERAQGVAESGRWAEFGTCVHAWADWVDLGLGHLRDVPEVVRPWVDAHLRLLAENGLTPLPEWNERVVMHSAYKIVGTLDRVFVTETGEVVLGDVKTSRTMDYSWLYFATQLAIYHSADLVLSADGTAWELKKPFHERLALVIHLPRGNPDHAELVPIDMGFGYEALEGAMLVRDLRKRSDKDAQSVLYTVGSEGLVNPRFYAARYLIQTSRTAAQMAQVWEEFADVWTDELTRLGEQMLALAATHRNAPQMP